MNLERAGNGFATAVRHAGCGTDLVSWFLTTVCVVFTTVMER
jgi:hypothetical protein